jgi:soluble lytic murein transglycosylase-like protein
MLSLLTLILGLSSQTWAQDFRTASLTPGQEMLGQSELPTVLPPDEIARYQRIFALEERGAWRDADREIARLQDPLLLGPVLAERYLSRSYHSSYAELAAWLERYADQPDAKAIHALALRRKPSGAAAPPRPVPVALEDEDQSDAPLDGGLPPRAAIAQRQISALAETDPRRAEALLGGPEAKRVLDPDRRDELRAEIAASYLRAGEAQDAIVVTAHRADEGAAPLEDWEAGLAAWRLGRWEEARQHFEALVRGPVRSPWIRSAAAFWAARVAIVQHRRDRETYWLGVAAEAPRTFYGLIALRLLGQSPDFDFESDPFTVLDAAAVTSLDAGRRALALLAVGERGRAVAELRALAQRDSPALLQALLGLAARANLAAFSLELAGTLAESDGRTHDAALYPVPGWTPLGGFAVDRALLFALMRQESLFVPRVASTAGALGVMQLMPATAEAMAARAGVSLARSGGAQEAKALADPELNLTIAQAYVRELLREPGIRNNLILFALAYNKGPTAAGRDAELAATFRRDPLLFLESAPSQQTRQFTKHVLTNYWIYRLRLEQPTPDLDALAAGKWPTYMAFDASPAPHGGRYAANR